MNRESWLTNAVVHFRGLFSERKLELPPNISVSCGFPSKSVGKYIGECWSNDQSDGGVFEVFISPRLSTVTGEGGVLATLAHELLHVAVGVENKHNKHFKDGMKKIGLEGKPSATVAGESLQGLINTMAATLGDYPHKKLNLKPKPETPKVKTLIKMKCPHDGCEYIIMVKTDLAASMGVPKCPVHNEQFVEA